MKKITLLFVVVLLFCCNKTENNEKFETKTILIASGSSRRKIEAKNALYDGVANAWRMAASHPCTGCYQVYHHEFGMLMDLNPKIMWNYIKSAFKN